MSCGWFKQKSSYNDVFFNEWEKFYQALPFSGTFNFIDAKNLFQVCLNFTSRVLEPFPQYVMVTSIKAEYPLYADSKNLKNCPTFYMHWILENSVTSKTIFTKKNLSVFVPSIPLKRQAIAKYRFKNISNML